MYKKIQLIVISSFSRLVTHACFKGSMAYVGEKRRNCNPCFQLFVPNACKTMFMCCSNAHFSTVNGHLDLAHLFLCGQVVS